MVKASNTIFQFYLAKMDFGGKYLSKKYPKSNSIEDTKHYQTVIIMKIVRMFQDVIVTERARLKDGKVLLDDEDDYVWDGGFRYLKEDDYS